MSTESHSPSRRRACAGPRSREVAHRMLLAAAVPRLAVRRDRASRALARALRTTALGRPPEDERDWIERIEARRHELIAGEAVARPQAGGESGAAREDSPPPSAGWFWISLPPLWCRFLMRLVRELAPGSCVELGTGFGISGAYQAASLELNGGGRFETFEGHADLARLAEQGFAGLGLGERVALRVGPIEETLPAAAGPISPVEYCFVDAEHTEEATVGYFEAMLPHLGEGAVVVLDDIEWSGVAEAWTRIRRHPRTSLAVNLRRLGVIVVGGS